MFQQQGDQAEQMHYYYWWRGPVLIAVALLSVAVSIAQSLSLAAIIQLNLLGLGIVLLSYDSARVGHEQLRSFLRRKVNAIVWDDMMYLFWHPNFDWWKVFVETFVGQASWMYILPSTSAQRMQLVQAALRVDEQEAQRILFAPGGYQNLLLPRTFVKWLEDGPSSNERNCDDQSVDRPRRIVDATTLEDLGSTPSSSSSSETSLVKECHSDSEVFVEHADAIGAASTLDNDNASHNKSSSVTAQNKSIDRPPSMNETMKSIIYKTLSDQLKDVLTYGPDPKQLATVGVTAAAALALQLRYSSRSRRIAMGVLEGSALAGLSTIGLGAASLLLAKTFGPGGNFPIREGNIVTYISKVLQLRTSLLGLRPSNTGGEPDNNRYKRGVVCAAIVAVLLTLRRPRQTGRLPRSRRR